jgi:octaprenyl-diphosphate synthase
VQIKAASESPAANRHIFRLIEPELREVESRLKTEATSHLPLINEMNEYLHDGGGKRLRPALLLLSSKACGVSGEPSLQLATVVELIHVATLVHDDIIDNSSLRRGQASINARWGNQMTVLFGDWLYMTAFWLALQERNFRILDVLIDITRKMVEGELIQLECTYRVDITEKEHLAISGLKTAHLFSGCGRLAAILGGLPSEEEEALAKYGRNLGLAFQLIDDLLDYASNSQLLGKPVLKDLEEGKITLPIIYLMQRATETERAQVEDLVQRRDFSPENKRRILEMVHRRQTLEPVLQLARKHAEAAQEQLASLPESLYRDALEHLPAIILERANPSPDLESSVRSGILP